jgi:hypothetical protein
MFFNFIIGAVFLECNNKVYSYDTDRSIMDDDDEFDGLNFEEAVNEQAQDCRKAMALLHAAACDDDTESDDINDEDLYFYDSEFVEDEGIDEDSFEGIDFEVAASNDHVTETVATRTEIMLDHNDSKETARQMADSAQSKVEDQLSITSRTVDQNANSSAKTKTQSFDNVFVKDDQYAWLPAEIVEYSGLDRVKVRIKLPPCWTSTTLMPGGNHQQAACRDLHDAERWIDLNDYHNHQLPIQNTRAARDMAELPHLHEAAVLYELKTRHAAQLPYTRAGDSIIAVNPCCRIDALYSAHVQRAYARQFVWQGKRCAQRRYICALY